MVWSAFFSHQKLITRACDPFKFRKPWDELWAQTPQTLNVYLAFYTSLRNTRPKHPTENLKRKTLDSNL